MPSPSKRGITNKALAANAPAPVAEPQRHRPDLPGVVSKYLSETEKQLRRVFEAAERGGAIQQTDEADALFGKRSGTQDDPKT